MEHEWLPEENLEEHSQICFFFIHHIIALCWPTKVFIECKHQGYQILKKEILSSLSRIFVS